MQRTHKIRMMPNNKQSTYLARCCGVARFAYNWGLARWKEQYDAHMADPDNTSQPNQYDLRKQLNLVKHEQFPWMMEVSKYAPQQALINLGRAFGHFFRKNGRYPQFKKKGEHDSFYIGSDQIAVDGDRV